MRTYIERVPVDSTFAGKGDTVLDRVKAMRADGWDVVVLIEHKPPTSKGARMKPTGDVIVLGCRE